MSILAGPVGSNNDERERARKAISEHRLVAQVLADRKAKVTRPKRIPTPVAERPEPTPYEKFGGSHVSYPR